LNGISWPNAEAAIHSQGSASSVWNDAFVEAMNNWNGLSNFSYKSVGAYMDPCADPNTYGPPWYSGWSWRFDICGIAFGSGVLAVNITWYIGSTIVQSGTVFNASLPWDVHSGFSANYYDFRRVATHELGHALGLGHDDTYPALMNRYYSETIEIPQPDDINGLRALYGGGGADRHRIEAFVTRFYQQCLGRDPEPTGLNYYTNNLINGVASGADVAGSFIFSPEFIGRNTTNEDFLFVMYRAFFDREPDESGWAYYNYRLNIGVNREEIFYNFIFSPEFEDLCNRYGIVPYFL
jgi:hypothetical protein